MWNQFTTHIKALESRADRILYPHLPVVVRLDGVGFRHFTKDLRVPFDVRFTRSMISMAADLVSKFNASIAYTISDEVTLVIPPAEFPGGPKQNSGGNNARKRDMQKETARDTLDHMPFEEAIMYANLQERDPTCTYRNRTHPYSGRTSKLCSIVASYASCRFNYHFHMDHDWSDIPSIATGSNNKFPTHLGYFDARVYTLSSPQDCLKLLQWRQTFDGSRNVINRLGHHFYGHKAIMNLSRPAILERVARTHQTGVPSFESVGDVKRIDTVAITDAEDIAPAVSPADQDLGWQSTDGLVRPEIAWGSFIKKERVPWQTQNPKTGEVVNVERSRISVRSLILDGLDNEDAYRVLFERHWRTKNGL